ncbi:hypothetical protein M9Y10_014547 [Tritrichomonas musculus]|uniref:DUF3447 domain-containing protein n=1 Tax=Tritrichomonas musculus TaxID=1915356 RepID=A0ABR2KZU1_9EUKA
MNILSYLQTLSEIQQKINGFLENESNNEQDFSDLKSFLDSQNFMKNKNLLKEVLHLLLIISNNYYKNINVYKKNEFIIKNLKNSIQKHFSKFEIFNIFKDSKRLLLFLFQENLINFDYSVKAIISNLKYTIYNYPQYFYQEVGCKPMKFEELPDFMIHGTNAPDIKHFEFLPLYLNIKVHQNKHFYKNACFEEPQSESEFKLYNKKRLKGVNDNYLALLIQEDNIRDFTSHVIIANIPLNSQVEPSIYETNLLLLKKAPTLIQYSAFYGSFKIFNYLFSHLSDISTIWPYAIHGGNINIIHFLVDHNIWPENGYFGVFIEAIKCHSIKIADYIKNNFLYDENKEEIIITCLKYHNYAYLLGYVGKVPQFFNYLVKYDYFPIVESIMKSSKKFDINKTYELHKGNYKVIECALHSAVKHENLEIIKLLLNHPKIEINKEKKCYKNDLVAYSKAALHIAVEQQNIEIVSLLLPKCNVNKEKEVKIFPPPNFEETINSLFIALIYKNIEMFKILLSHPKIDINQENTLEMSFLGDDYRTHTESSFILAIELGLTDFVKLMLKHSKGKVNNNNTLKNEQIDVTLPNFNSKSNNFCVQLTPLSIAIERNYNDIVALLLKSSNVDVKKLSYQREQKLELPIETALNVGNVEAFKLLLSKKDVDINNSIVIEKDVLRINTNILILAIEKKNIEIIKLLLAKKKVDVNSTKIISSLNDNGLNVRYRKRRSDEMSCLHIAVQTGNPEIVKLLLSFKKINLNALSYTEENIDRYNANYKVLTMVVHANVKMMTPLAMAIKDQNVEIIKLLLECKGIDLIKESYDNDVNNFYESKKAGMWNFIKEDVKKTGCNALEIAKGTHNQQIIELVAKYFK